MTLLPCLAAAPLRLLHAKGREVCPERREVGPIHLLLHALQVLQRAHVGTGQKGEREARLEEQVLASFFVQLRPIRVIHAVQAAVPLVRAVEPCLPEQGLSPKKRAGRTSCTLPSNPGLHRIWCKMSGKCPPM